MAKVKCKLLADCFGPSVVGKKGDTVEVDERHLSGLGRLVEPVKGKAKK